MKPFKPPTLVGRAGTGTAKQAGSSEPPQKKRRISPPFEDDDPADVLAAANYLKKPTQHKTFQAPARKALVDVQNVKSTLPSSSTSQEPSESYYNVLWRKFTTKKNKTWDGDGVLSVSGSYARLQDDSGKELGKGTCKGALLPGSGLSIGGKEIEIESIVSRADFLAGRPFLIHVKQPSTELSNTEAPSKMSMKAKAKHEKVAEKWKDNKRAIGVSQSSKNVFRTPLLNDTVLPASKDRKLPVPRHDPNAENALVMKRPDSVPKSKQIVDVVVDPILTKHLREHQRNGVAFMYECVMGLKKYSGEGAILADEMGLGKTLQTIALIWTLLKQNPVYEAAPVIKKVLIVCPVTLINNWRREFKKWLGSDRIGVFILQDKRDRLTHFTMGRSYSVMIIGYEKLRMVQQDLQKGEGIDLVIADEGHRMKTAQNKSAQAIRSLNTERRIILSGTPLQNDLAEFYTMVDFVNPGLLNKYTAFKREFETPILKSQQPGASKKDLEKGEARAEELANITSVFILRRTAEILSNYLPAKTEYVVFCRPTEAQMSVYRAIVGSPTFNAALGSTAIQLELINILKKVCNSPDLLLKKAARADDKAEGSTLNEVLKSVSPSLLRSPDASGKLLVLKSLLHHISSTTEEKVVLVSNYTSTLDVLATLLSSRSYKYLRLDGTVPQNKRQELVDRFNRSPPSNSLVFLLSAKAGGVGLNLIGASRMILFDLDWNPATDLQAMARVYRDGQKRPCYIYRMVTQGAIDEKIFQRQVSKTGLADSIVDSKNSVSGFSSEELKDLFTLDEAEHCQTHKLLGCDCGGKGLPMAEPEEEEDDAVRNDLAALSSNDEPVVRDENGTEVLRLDENDELPTPKRKSLWKKATEYDPDAEEAELQRSLKDCRDSSGKAKMKSLMAYAHFDTALAAEYTNDETRVADSDAELDGDVEIPRADPLEGVIEDAVLRDVIREDGRRVGFVFSKLGA